ncbi:hypothetical protein DPEC_G00072270 [Dallia pectoralis]|uniref:Uncharacterized protein n=1 Tax=Dallia pectoralis TaxID=75939 RepID=A0ACC2H378_DALPE|nr:hypothetical protein DPEC_G00072270 [Dallia pectoralis]
MLASLGEAMNRVLTTMQHLETRIPEPVAAAAVPLPESPPWATRGSRDGIEGVDQTWCLGFAPRLCQGSSAGSGRTAIRLPEVDVPSQGQLQS